MDVKLTYLSIFFFITCLLSSCSSDAPDNVDSKGSEMSFTVSELSRATVTTTINIPGSKFAVYGDRKLSVDNNTEPSVIFNKIEVEYIDNSWSYNNPQYWFTNNEHSFVAVYPVSVLEPDNKPQYSNSKLSFTYILPTSDGNKVKPNDVIDILTATHRRLYYQGNDTPISLRFSHLLSLINIAPALDDNLMDMDAYILFHKLELTGLKTKATFNVLPAQRLSNNQTDDRVIEVTGQDGEGNMAIEFAEPKKIMNRRGNVRLFDDNDAIIMLPQTFGSDSQAEIILTYTLNNDTRQKQLSIPLDLLGWESGKSYTYRFTIDRNGPRFDTTTITSWEMLNVGNFDVH